MELDELSVGQSSAVRIACYGNYRTEDAYMAHPEQASTKRGSFLSFVPPIWRVRELRVFISK